MYPNNEIPEDSDYTWTNTETGLTWKGYCDGAYRTAAAGLAVASALVFSNI